MRLEKLSAAQAVSGQIRVAAELSIPVHQSLIGARLAVSERGALTRPLFLFPLP